MHKVFAEFAILSEMRLIYLNHMRELLKREGRLSLSTFTIGILQK
jgi:hypothetical protein